MNANKPVLTLYMCTLLHTGIYPHKGGFVSQIEDWNFTVNTQFTGCLDDTFTKAVHLGVGSQGRGQGVLMTTGDIRFVVVFVL